MKVDCVKSLLRIQAEYATKMKCNYGTAICANAVVATETGVAVLSKRASTLNPFTSLNHRNQIRHVSNTLLSETTSIHATINKNNNSPILLFSVIFSNIFATNYGRFVWKERPLKTKFIMNSFC